MTGSVCRQQHNKVQMRVIATASPYVPKSQGPNTISDTSGLPEQDFDACVWLAMCDFLLVLCSDLVTCKFNKILTIRGLMWFYNDDYINAYKHLK